ncbi:MAG: GNAT family N-acetyltransferase [Xanthobacteraceae bacterium]|nr:GNAT family N-acetyltransferase [Xanthobacteraceae bacterium]QYK45436.1 MAG: GNAT family N-acetyltransferase [Xanthobacteraceae bacterium]
MAFFKTLLTQTFPSIEGKGVTLRVPRLRDFEEWAALRAASREFLSPWEPVWPEDDLTRAAYRRRLRRYEADLREEMAYSFFIFRKSDDALIGGVTLANLRRGAAQSGSIGYWMGKVFAGQGYMTAGVAALLPFSHGMLRLRRLEAACLPSNGPSIRLLEKLNFQREGLAREYLSIAGKWQDHILYARLTSDPVPDVAMPGR